MFNRQYYEIYVQELHTNQLCKQPIKCNKCFFLAHKNETEEEIKYTKNCLKLIDCNEMYLFFDKTPLSDSTHFIVNSDVKYKVALLDSMEQLYNVLDLEISISKDGKSLVLLYDDKDRFTEIRNTFLEEAQEAFKDWNEKMSQPLKPVLLNEQEIEKLREQGRV